MKKSYEVHGQESGFVKEFKTMKEAKKFIIQLKKFDKENGIEDTYEIIVSN